MKLGVHGLPQLVLWQQLITVMSHVISSIQIDKIVEMIALMDYLELISVELGHILSNNSARDQTARQWNDLSKYRLYSIIYTVKS